MLCPLENPPRLRQLSILRCWCLFFCRFMGDESNADFPVFVISCRVAKIKNTNCQTKPFRPIIERPIAAWFWQEVHESLNQIVDAPFIVGGGASLLGQNLSRLNLTPDIHEVCLFYWIVQGLGFGSLLLAAYIREIHDAYSLTLYDTLPNPD